MSETGLKKTTTKAPEKKGFTLIRLSAKGPGRPMRVIY